MLMSMTLLTSSIDQYLGPSCGGSITVTSTNNSHRGFCHFIDVICQDCGLVKTSSSTTIADGSYDVNSRMVFSFLNCGRGFSGLYNLCEMMEMQGLSQKTHASHVNAIHNVRHEMDKETIDDTVKRVRAAHGTPTGTLEWTPASMAPGRSAAIHPSIVLPW